MKLNLTGVQAFKLNGEPMPNNLREVLGDVLYTHTSGIKYARVAQDIFDGKDVDLSEEELNYFIKILESDTCYTILSLKVAIIDYINSLLTNKEK